MRNVILSNIAAIFLPKRPTLLQVLRHIQKYGPLTKSHGICRNFDRVAPNPATLSVQFAILAVTWPEYSGNRQYPVPNPAFTTDAMRYYAAQVSYHTKPKWRGDYGKLRYELIDWCIKQLERQHADATD